MFVFRLKGSDDGDLKTLNEVKLNATTLIAAKREATKDHTPSFKRERNDRSVKVSNWTDFMTSDTSYRRITIIGDKGQNLAYYEVWVVNMKDRHIRTIADLRTAIADVPDETQIVFEGVGCINEVMTGVALETRFYDPNNDEFVHPDHVEEMHGEKHGLESERILILS